MLKRNYLRDISHMIPGLVFMGELLLVSNALAETCYVGATCSYDINSHSQRIISIENFKKGHIYQCKFQGTDCVDIRSPYYYPAGAIVTYSDSHLPMDDFFVDATNMVNATDYVEETFWNDCYNKEHISITCIQVSVNDKKPNQNEKPDPNK